MDLSSVEAEEHLPNGIFDKLILVVTWIQDIPAESDGWGMKFSDVLTSVV